MENMYNLNIERAVLSAIIFDPEIYEEIAAKLSHQDFYLPFHQHVFSAMEELSREEKPIDEEFLRSKLVSMGKFDEVAMLDLLSANPISNTAAYLTEIKAKSSKRALATLAYADKRRQKFARSQLVATLEIIQAGDVTREQLTGSWAGAMGHTQFIPTSFLAYGVDMDGDGRRDIWHSIPDALATAANLLHTNKWRTGKSWGYEVIVPANGAGLNEASC